MKKSEKSRLEFHSNGLKLGEDVLSRSSLLGEKGGSVKAEVETPDEDDHLDGPWSFVVGVASFLAQIMLGGYVYTGGIYYTVFIEEFHMMGTMAVSWMCNLPVTLWFLGGPFGSMLTNRFGTRICSYIGGCLACVGLSLCYFTSNFYILFLGYGVIAGFGHGIMFIGFVTSVTRYFKKYRAMVTILSTLGPMVGMSLYSFLIPYLYRRLHWRGSLLVLGGISLNICVCASVLFPVKSAVTTKKMAFIDVLKIRELFLFGCNSVFISLASSLIFLHLPSLVIANGLGADMASVTLTVFAISNSSAKVICSIVGQFYIADPVYVYNGFLTVYGVAILLLPVDESAGWVLAVVVVFSFCFNVCGGHTMEVVLDLTGTEKFTSGVGIAQLGKGIGYLLAGPLAGIMFEASGSYKTSFYVSGGLDIIGCSILLPVIIQKCRGVRKRSGEMTVIVAEDARVTSQCGKVREVTMYVAETDAKNSSQCLAISKRPGEITVYVPGGDDGETRRLHGNMSTASLDLQNNV